MPEEKSTKGIFDAAINLVTNRDEKAALEAAKQQVAEIEARATAAEAKARELEASLAKAQSELAKAQTQETVLAKVESDLKNAKAYIAELEPRLSVAESKARLFDQLQAQGAAAAEAAAQIIETHVMTDKETLSDLALHYYGHATKKYWMLIYKANEAAIGDNPNQVRPGTALQIPVLPPDFK